ncbi:AMP-binding protein [Roseiterribacter gracilis]|uniref:3-methylmercaptopropionyl-CoA ligase n=1 Tax=Roseiterribacter gracilis TaxID=2812848 RepID=A0A8S8X9H5_9PROT|nr:acyl-CoA synthetase [Rhodospirillales bacterium TMPK1]
MQLDDLPQTQANYVPLSPLSLLRRTASVHPERIAVRHGAITYDYATLERRCIALAAALNAAGIGQGDVVSIIAANTPAHLEAHFGVAMAGAVLHSVNIRLGAREIDYQLRHAQTALLLVDDEFATTVAPIVGDIPIVRIRDAAVPAVEDGARDYESFLASGDKAFVPRQGPDSEWDAITLNYTSGTTGNPKGVVYHHRGAYLNAVANVLAASLGQHPVYLWTLPMFHCNGWCFPWTVTALAGTHVCLRKPDPQMIRTAIEQNHVTLFCAAPTVLTMLLAASNGVALGRDVRVLTAGAPPPAAVIAGCQSIGLDVTHVYGLTEVYGPCVVSEWKDAFNQEAPADQARRKARQGVRYHLQEDLAVLDPETMQPVPADGTTIGEVMLRGNIVMRGYYKDTEATERAFRGGWFHTGDLAVCHPDSYVEIKDRSKDIVISGGENISSIEVENALFDHPAVLEAAVVARPDAKWGETPCAFVTLKPGRDVTADELIDFCRTRIAAFKVPRTIIFGALPKTSTGKVKKFELRERARALT